MILWSWGSWIATHQASWSPIEFMQFLPCTVNINVCKHKSNLLCFAQRAIRMPSFKKMSLKVFWNEGIECKKIELRAKSYECNMPTEIHVLLMNFIAPSTNLVCKVTNNHPRVSNRFNVSIHANNDFRFLTSRNWIHKFGNIIQVLIKSPGCVTTRIVNRTESNWNRIESSRASTRKRTEPNRPNTKRSWTEPFMKWTGTNAQPPWKEPQQSWVAARQSKAKQSQAKPSKSSKPRASPSKP